MHSPFSSLYLSQTAAELVVIEKAKKAEQAERAIAAKELKKDIAEALEKKRVEMEVAAKAYVNAWQEQQNSGGGVVWASRFFQSLWLAVSFALPKSIRGRPDDLF